MEQYPFLIAQGSPLPFGPSQKGDRVNFSLISTQAKKISLCLFTSHSKTPLYEIPLDPEKNKTGHVWHIELQNPPTYFYLYRIDDSLTFVIDPYCKSLFSNNEWNTFSDISASYSGEKKHVSDYFPMAYAKALGDFDWQGISPPYIPKQHLIVYEMHIRGFTQDPSSHVTYPGTYLGVIEKIPYLLDLGINAIEFLPVFEFNSEEYRQPSPVTGELLCNYWGYSPVHFFSPMQKYASRNTPEAGIHEFKQMVRELHRNGIEVILDVVYNHTAEGGQNGPTFSFKALDPLAYYLFNENKHSNFSGCGNTMSCNHPFSIELILQSLRYWVTEMHIDGFRFDLASILYRGTHGELLPKPPLVEAISQDPILAGTKLIAEPWDAAGVHQVGGFCQNSKRWSEWNDRYRDTVRSFIKGTGSKETFATRLCGSQDVYFASSPQSSLNFITAHDGFTLADLVSYNNKHNLGNGEKNRDGTNNNVSWNCGKEGPTQDPDILALRARQMRNFLLALFISRGIPMLHMGDEYGHTKQGNNNTWCQDNVLNWFLWDQKEGSTLYRFCKKIIEVRRRYPVLQNNKFFRNGEIDWHGKIPYEPQWNTTDHFLAYTLKTDVETEKLYLAFNASSDFVSVQLPAPPLNTSWHWLVNTGRVSPEDIYEETSSPLFESTSYQMLPYSAMMLHSKEMLPYGPI
jgi:isoamylase/glycogen operon protein